MRPVMITGLSFALLAAIFQTNGYGTPAQFVISVLLTLILGVGGLYVRSMVSQLTSLNDRFALMQSDVNTKLGIIQTQLSTFQQSHEDMLRRMGQVEERQYQMEQKVGEDSERITRTETTLILCQKNCRKED